MRDRGDPLWVPLLSHFKESSAGLSIDCDRILAQAERIRPHVNQHLLAGTTGDGWEMPDSMLADLVGLSGAPAFDGARILVGALGATTESVVRRARIIEEHMATLADRGRFEGLAICAPVDAAASQDEIIAHYQAVLAATSSPIAVYELPQITGCSITPETMQTLSALPRVTMFKDSGGVDRLVRSDLQGVRKIRGAEGDYLPALVQMGYDGLLLSTANVFGAALRRILDLTAAGEFTAAASISDLLSTIVDGLFSAARNAAASNVFSTVSRGVDHLMANGRDWRSVPPPLTISGERLSPTLIEELEDRLLHLTALGEGYLRH